MQYVSGLISKYINLANEAGYNALFDKKRTLYWEKKEKVYDNMIIKLCNKWKESHE